MVISSKLPRRTRSFDFYTCFTLAKPTRLCETAGRRTPNLYRHVESVMNHLVNHRLSKKQQMRWSLAGAHYLLQVRAELLRPGPISGVPVYYLWLTMNSRRVSAILARDADR